MIGWPNDVAKLRFLTADSTQVYPRVSKAVLAWSSPNGGKVPPWMQMETERDIRDHTCRSIRHSVTLRYACGELCKHCITVANKSVRVLTLTLVGDVAHAQKQCRRAISARCNSSWPTCLRPVSYLPDARVVYICRSHRAVNSFEYRC